MWMNIDGRHRSGHCLRCQLRPERHDGLYDNSESCIAKSLADSPIADEWKNDPRNPNAKSGGH
jgi:hypothetical protein